MESNLEEIICITIALVGTLSWYLYGLDLESREGAPPSINQIAELLSKENDLDEKKFLNNKRRNNIKFFTCILLTTGSLLIAIPSGTIMGLFFLWFFKLHTFKVRKATYLHNFGIKTEGIIESIRIRHTRSGAKIYTIIYSYIAPNSKEQHIINCKADESSLNFDKTFNIKALQKNQKVDVLYNPDFPKISLFTIKKDKQFTLRKSQQ